MNKSLIPLGVLAVAFAATMIDWPAHIRDTFNPTASPDCKKELKELDNYLRRRGVEPDKVLVLGIEGIDKIIVNVPEDKFDDISKGAAGLYSDECIGLERGISQ